MSPQFRAELRAYVEAFGLTRPASIRDQYPTPVRNLIRKLAQR